MSEQDPELEAFSKFIDALEPWLGEVVLVGGWAHRLYRLDGRARKLDYLPLTTLDGDVAVPSKLKKEELTVRKRLLEAGFEEEFVGEHRPPATHFHYRKGGGFYAEFLAPLEGSEYDRNGKRKATKEVGGVSSQLLRYIELAFVYLLTRLAIISISFDFAGEVYYTPTRLRKEGCSATGAISISIVSSHANADRLYYWNGESSTLLESFEAIELLLTHQLTPTGPIPTTSEPNSFYPYESFCETSRRPVLKKYRMVSIENERIRVKICPDLGGRVCSIFLKETKVETLFFPRVIRPVRILPRQSFAGGGIELSFPISHSPVQIIPVAHEVMQEPGRIYVSCGERELRFGMNWTVEYSLGEDDTFLSQRTVFYNPDRDPHAWMSWSNAGVPARADTEFHFPDGPVLAHGRELRIIDWKTQGPRCQADVRRMTGFFWKRPDCCAFGVFTPSLSAGLYHVADPLSVPGIKLWTDGIGRDEAWVNQYTLDGEQCLEIQGGPLVDQSLKDILQPGHLWHHVEFWIPSATPCDIRKISLPCPRMKAINDIPLFGWARSEDVSFWLSLISAQKSGEIRQIPHAPDLDSNSWAISGMADLGEALSWAALSTQGRERDRWLFQRGAWLAARGQTNAALEVLGESGDDRARALSGRLWLVDKQDANAAAKCFRSIESEAIALHPQVVIERDQALAVVGREALHERGRWLNAVSALDDEWLAERRASWLIDCGNAQAAFDVLKGNNFQLVHQRYQRTRLWRQIEASLGLDRAEYPSWLGEDDLAEFGAYRDHPAV